MIASRFRPRPHFPPLNICDDQIRASVSARNIGVIFDSYMNFECQVSSVCKASFFHIRNVSRIRKYLSVESTKILVHAFVTCRLDNGNALLYGLPKYLIERLQAVMNCAARLILRKQKYTEEIQRRYQKEIKRQSFKIKVVEKAGVAIKKLLQRHCPLCREDGKGPCDRQSVTYDIKCAECMFISEKHQGARILEEKNT